MAHWNYRLVRKTAGDEPFFELHEVFYDDAGVPTGMTDEPVGFGGDTPEEVASALEMALRDVRARPVFDPPATWGERSKEVGRD
jgi:hypothetical protein